MARLLTVVESSGYAARGAARRASIAANGINPYDAYLGLRLRFPFGPRLPRIIPHPVPVFTSKEQWEEEPYNPPSWYGGEPDPDADPKPSWDSMIRGKQLYDISKAEEQFSVSDAHLEDSAHGVATALISHSAADTHLHVGSGISLLSAMIHLLDRSGTAGENWPLTIMRDRLGKTVRLWAEGEGRELLQRVSHSKNRAESARNIVREQISDILAIAQDPEAGLAGDETADVKLAVREEAVQKLSAFDQPKIQKLMTEALKEYDDSADELPEDDLPKSKRVLTERLEGVATARMKAIKFAEGQNGVDLHAACDDEGIAHTEIAAEKKKGQIRIERAQTIEAAKAAGKAATKAINDVKALRTPVFHKFLSATNSERIHGDSVTYQEESVKIRAQHPTWRESRLAIPGEVSMFGHVETNAEGVIPEGAFLDFQVPDTVSQLGEMDVTLSAKAGVRTEYRLTGRSLCGPSLLTVILDPPAKETPAS